MTGPRVRGRRTGVREDPAVGPLSGRLKDLQPATATVLLLASEPEAVHDAREWVRTALSGWPEPGIEIARLLVTEVVTNAVLHARTPIEVRVRPLGGTSVRIEVGDRLRASPLRKHYKADAATGRGLRLVESLATEWGVSARRDGKVIWFVVSRDAVSSGRYTAATAGAHADHDGHFPRLSDSRDAGPRGDAAPGGGAAPGGDKEPVLVRITGLPLAVYLEAEQHNDEVLRELSFIVQSSRVAPSNLDVPRRLLELAREMRSVFSTATTGLRLQVEDAIRRGSTTVDLDLRVPRTGGEMLLRLASQLDEVDRFCEEGDLLALASSPTLRRFRSWYARQVADQLAGLPPQPWPGT